MPTNKYFACPFCKERLTREDMVVHISRKHINELPEGFTPLRATFHTVNRKNFKYNRPCRICKKPTPWNESKGRYDFLCTDPNCKKAWIENMKLTMGDKYGAFRPTATAEGLEKMLAARKISGTYKFTSGGEVPYTGSYEKKCLEFMDKVLNVKIEDVQVPGPVIKYPFKGQTHIYIPDIYYKPYNLIIEVKDGGSNPNTHPGYSEVRAKKIAKENYVLKHTEYNYLRQTDNDFSQLLGVFADLKLHLNNDDKSRVTHVHETALGENMGLAAINPIVGFIPGKDVVIAHNTNRQTFGIANSPKFEKIVTLNHLNQLGLDKAENFGSKEDVKLYVKKNIYPKIEKDIEKFMDKEMTEQAFYEMIFGHPMYTKDQILFEDVIDYSKFLDNMEIFTIEATLNTIFGKDDEESICEGFEEFKSTFLNEEDVKYNYDAFSKGTSDILFITGPGSFGKANDFVGIAEQFGADIIHLDDVQKHYLYSDKKLKEKHKLIYKYFTETDKGIEYRKKKKKDIEVNLYETVPNFILYFLDNKEKDKRYIIEGTQILDLLAADRLDINLFRKYSILLKGSSYLQTQIQTMKSDMNNDSEEKAFKLLTDYIDAISKEVKKVTHDNFSKSLRKKEDIADKDVSDVIKDAMSESCKDESKINEVARIDIQSNYLEKGDDCYNLNLWAPGNNILYVTGISGSGKTTLAKDLANEFSVQRVELDNISVYYLKKCKDRNSYAKFYKFIMDDCPIATQFIDENPVEVVGVRDKFGDTLDIQTHFCEWFRNKVQNDQQLYIINGASLVDVYPASFFYDKPIILKDINYVKNVYRRVAREFDIDEKFFTKVQSGYKSLKTGLSKGYRNANNNFKNFKYNMDTYSTFKESVDKSTIDNDFQKKSDKTFDIYDINDKNLDKFLDSNTKLKKFVEWQRKVNKSGEVAIDKDTGNYAGNIGCNKDGRIGALYIEPEYRGYGLSNTLVKDAIDKFNGKELGVFTDNDVAINLYKNNGFKIKEKKTGDEGDYYVMTKESTLLENNLFNSKDIYYNKDKFDSGEINLCFITGHGGSGKSTMGKGMNADHYELDDVTQNWNFSDQDLKKYGNLIYQFFNTAGKKFRYRSEEDMEAGNNPLDDTGDNYDKELVTAFVNYAKSYAKSHPYEKIVIEGIQLFLFIPPESIKDYAVYIKGTSKLVSAFRAANRDTTNDGLKGFEKVKGMIKTLTDKKTNKYRTEDEAMINKYRKFFTETVDVDMSILEVTDVYYNLDNWCRENNILYVTGLTGSGKTYLANKLSESVDCELVSLDNISFNYMTNRSNARVKNNIYNTLNEQCPDALEFFKNNHYELHDKYRDTIYIQKEFCDWFVKSHLNNGKKYILEGDLLFYVHPANWYADKPIIIKNESYENICRRRVSRNIKDSTSEVIEEHAKLQIQNTKLREYYDYIVDQMKLLKEAVSNNKSIILEDSFDVEKFDKNFKSKKANFKVKKLDINNPEAKSFIQNDSYTKKYLKYLSENTGEILIDSTNNKLIGYIFVGDKKDKGFISTLAINKEYRGYGFGKTLLNDAVNKYNAIDLVVDKDNKVAIDLYKNNGFDIVKEVNGDQYWMKLKSNINEMMEESYDDVVAVKPVISDPYFIKSDDGVDNACIDIQGYDHPSRGRSSMIILKFEDGQWKVFFSKDTENDHEYHAPGGGWNKGETPKDAAIREAQEEVLINVKDVKYEGYLLEYHDEVQPWVKEHVRNPKDWWYGYYSEIFVGMYDSKFTGKVDDRDKDQMANSGKWYNFKDIKEDLTPIEYREAIENYIMSSMNESAEDDVFYCIEDDTIDLTGDLEDYPILEVSEEDLKKNMGLSPVFVMLSFNGGIVGKVIKGYGKDLGWEYSHSSISLVPSLSTLYSFNITKTTDDEGKKHKYNGLAIEHFRDFRDNPKCKIKVIAILVDTETRNKIKKAIQYYIDNIDKTKYATTSLAKALFGTGGNVQNYGNMTLFCSQFVDSVLKQANIDIGGRGSSVNTHPSELGQFKDKNNYFTVYEGKASGYDEDKVNEKILYMKQTMTYKELNAITDKSSTVDKDDHRVENRAKQYVERKINKFKEKHKQNKPEPLDGPLAVEGG